MEFREDDREEKIQIFLSLYAIPPPAERTADPLDDVWARRHPSQLGEIQSHKEPWVCIYFKFLSFFFIHISFHLAYILLYFISPMEEDEGEESKDVIHRTMNRGEPKTTCTL